MRRRLSGRSVLVVGVAALSALTALGSSVDPALAALSATSRGRLGQAGWAGALAYTEFGWDNRPVSVPVQEAGTFAGAPKGSSAELLSKAFPFTGPLKPGAKEPLKVGSGGTAFFSFTVQPETATEYFVELLNPDGSVNGIFQLQTVYVISTRRLVAGPVSCKGTACTIGFTLERFLPRSVSAEELRKPYYLYLGVSFAKKGIPPAPKYMYLQHHFTASRTTPVAGVDDEYEATFSVSFTAAEADFTYVTDACTIDSEAADGFGLPGSHGCGSPKVPTDTSYLG